MNLKRIPHHLSYILNLFFPLLCPVCGEKITEQEEVICDSCRQSFYLVTKPICPVCGAGEARINEGRCNHCPKREIYFDAARSVFSYRGSAGEAVQELKFHSRTELAPVIGRMVFLYLEQDAPELKADGIIPVPLHPTRKRERGYNQSLLIAREVSRLSRIPLADELLIRIKPTKPQSRLDAKERRRNIKNAFGVQNTGEIKGRTFLLLDDVYTGGWTVNECAKVLKEAGASGVVALTVTRA